MQRSRSALLGAIFLLGIGPVGLKDKYCPSYFNEMRNLTLVNRAYCIRNPKHYKGFGPELLGIDRQLFRKRLRRTCSQ